MAEDRPIAIEVNCETDFTAKNEEFVGMVNDICLQIAATNAAFIHSSQVDQETITKETEIAKASLVGKPEHAIAKIVEGKMNKFYSEVCLLEQPFVKDSSKKVKDVISEFAAKTKENIVVKRFVRYSL
jgi:elongation factor Ts